MEGFHHRACQQTGILLLGPARETLLNQASDNPVLKSLLLPLQAVGLQQQIHHFLETKEHQNHLPWAVANNIQHNQVSAEWQLTHLKTTFLCAAMSNLVYLRIYNPTCHPVCNPAFQQVCELVRPASLHQEADLTGVVLRFRQKERQHQTPPHKVRVNNKVLLRYSHQLIRFLHFLKEGGHHSISSHREQILVIRPTWYQLRLQRFPHNLDP